MLNHAKYYVGAVTYTIKFVHANVMTLTSKHTYIR